MTEVYVCVDFDGTMVTHEYPEIGRDIGAFEYLLSAQREGAKIILFTMRSGVELGKAIDHCHKNGLQLYGINRNPTQDAWTTSPKAYGHIYVDDAALGTPLVKDLPRERPHVDWKAIGPALLESVKTKKIT